MNREIIFRGKLTFRQSEWIYGYYFVDGLDARILEAGEFTGLEVLKETVGQYTGLKDKNGDKIFEGDIICDGYDASIYTVKFDDYRGGWYPFAQGDGCGCCESEVCYPNNCEIIGNKIDGKIKEPTKLKSIHLTGDNLKQWVSFKAEKDRVEGIPLEDEDGENN